MRDLASNLFVHRSVSYHQPLHSMSPPLRLSHPLWIRTTILGWFLGFVFVVALSAFFEGLGLSAMQFHVGVAMAMGVSVAQWWVLRKRGFNSGWIWYAIAGMGLPFITVDLYYLNSSSAVSENHLALGAGSGAMLMAVFQSIILRKTSPPAARRWIVLSTLGWWIAAGSVMLTSYTMKTINQPLLGFFVNLVLILIGGPLLGWLTASTIMSAVTAARFQKLYSNFNRRNIDAVISEMTDNVVWANGMEGGFVHGHEGVRAYWTRQFAVVSPNVTPIEIHEENGVIRIRVRQTVHDLAGKMLVDQEVAHRFTLKGDKISKFDIEVAEVISPARPEDIQVRH